MNAIILAGGKNSRIGTRKALLEIDGKTIMQRTIDLLKPHFGQLFLITNEPEVYGRYGLPMTTDEIEGEGPLGGIHAGLGISEAEYNLVVACDMPFLDETLIKYIKDTVENVAKSRKEQGLDSPLCVVPKWQKGIEPLHSVYHRDLRLQIVEAVTAGERKMGYLVRKWDAFFLELDEWAKENGVDLQKIFSNVNTWDEFNQARHYD